MSQSLINQGNILTLASGPDDRAFNNVAIPYKSGKYSYETENIIVYSLLYGVAIPYKSGKYSYFFKKISVKDLETKRRNPL